MTVVFCVPLSVSLYIVSHCFESSHVISSDVEMGIVSPRLGLATMMMIVVILQMKVPKTLDVVSQLPRVEL